MKKVLVFIWILAAALALAACGTGAQAEAVGTVQPGQVGTPGGTADREMPLALELALGTFKLEDSDVPIDAQQAATLLPLWKAARSLGESETAAAQEVDAVIKQIEGSMTSDQLAAIDEMNLTMQDYAAIADDLGFDIGFGGRFGEMTPEMQATREAMRESGQFPGGGFGGGVPGGGGGPGGGAGGGPGGGGEFNPEAMQTAIAERGGTRGASFGVNSALLDAVIKFLESKVE